MASNKAFGSLLIEILGTTASLQKSMTQASGMLKKFQYEVESMNKVVTASFAFAIAEKTFEGIKSLSESVTELAVQGEKIQNLKEAFEALGGTTQSLNKAKEATMGVVSTVDLLEAANKGLVAGIPGFSEKFDQVAALGIRVGEALGISAADGVNRVTEAIIKGRPRQLEQIGIFINTGAAAKKYAEAHDIAAAASGSFEKALNKQQKQAANTAAAMDQLGDAINRFMPPTESVTKASEAAKNAFADLYNQLAGQLNSSPELTKAYKDLETALKGIDTRELAAALVDLTTIFVELKAKIISYAVPALEDFNTALHNTLAFLGALGDGNGINKALDIAAVEESGRKQKEYNDTLGSTGDRIDELSKKTSQYYSDTISKKAAPAIGVVEGLNKAYQQIQDTLNGLGQDSKNKITFEQFGNLSQVGSELDKLKEKAVDVQKNITAGAETIGQVAAKANAELDKIHAINVAGDLKQQFEASLKEGNFEAAQDYLTQYTAAITAAAVEEAKKFKTNDQDRIAQFIKDYVGKVIPAMENAQKIAFGEHLQKQFEESLKLGNLAGARDFLDQYQAVLPTLSEKGKETFDLMAKAFQDGIKRAFDNLASGANDFISSFQSLTGDLTTVFGITMPKGMQKVLDMAKGLVDIFTSIVKLVESISKISDAITALSGGIPGTGGGGIISTILQAVGLTDTTSGVSSIAGSIGIGSSASEITAGLTPGIATAGAGEGLTLGAGAASAAGGGAGIAATIAPALPYIAAAVAVYAIGANTNWFGLGHTRDPDTKARDQVGDYLKQHANFDLNQPLGTQFKAGGTAWNDFNKLDTSSKQTFAGIGEGLKAILGITQDIGPQIGAILATDMNGNLDKARILTQQLGISQQDMIAAVIKAGEQEGQTWLQIEGEIQGINNAYGEGLVKVGDLKGAVDELTSSGNKGQQALTGLHNIAIEGMQKGAKSMADLKNMLNAVWDPKQVDLLFKAMNAYGITSLAQLKSASTETEIAILSMFQALGGIFKDVIAAGDQATQSVQGVGNAALNIPNTPSTTPSGSGGGAIAHALGGIVNHRTMFRADGGLHLMGESGPEAILPLINIGGKLGVMTQPQGNNSKGLTLHIYAPNAEAGIEEKIKHTFLSMSPLIIEQAVISAVDTMTRGGNLQ